MVEVSGEVFIFEVEFIRSMNDGKMQKLLLGRGGASVYCVHTLKKRPFYCNKSKMVLKWGKLRLMSLTYCMTI